MIDLASLGLSIDSTSAETASKRLDVLADSGQRAANTADIVTAQYQKQNAAAQAYQQSLVKQSESMAGLSDSVQRVLNRYDPLGTKLRQLQADFAKLNDEVARGAGVGQEGAIDKAYAAMNKDIAQTQQLMETAATSTGHFSLASATATRELIVLGREAMTGNFSRIPGSLMVLASRSGIAGQALLGYLFNPITAVIAVVGTLAVALETGAHQWDGYQRAIAKTGGFAGLAAQDMRDMAQSISASGEITAGSGAKIVTALVGAGTLGGNAVRQLAGVVHDYAQLTGEDASKAAEQLTKAFSDPAQGAEELNRSMHFLTAADIDHIQSLQRLGETQEAASYAIDKFTDRVKNSKIEVGYWTDRMNEARQGWSWFVEHVQDFGSIAKPVTLDKLIADDPNAALARLQVLLTNAENAGSKEQVANYIALVDQVQARLTAEKQIREEQAAQAQQEQEQINTLNKINATRFGSIRQMEDELQRVRNFNPETPEQSAKQLEAIRQYEQQITDAYNALGARGRELAQIRIEGEEKVSETAIKSQIQQLDAEEKLGNITKLEHDQAVTFADLELNLVKRNAIERLLQLSGLSAAERARHQEELRNLDAERTAIKQRGADQSAIDEKAANDAIALSYAKIGEAVVAAGEKQVQEAQKALDVQRLHNAEIGKTKEQVEQAKQAQYDAATQNLELELAAVSAITEENGFGEEAVRIYSAMADELRKLIALRRQMSGEIGNGAALEAAAAEQKVYAEEWKKALDSVNQGLTGFFTDLLEHGSSAFKNLWERFKHFALEVLAEIASKQIIVSIVGAFGLGGATGAAAAGALGQSGNALGSFGNLLSGGSGAVSGYNALGGIGGAAASGYYSTATGAIAGDAFLPGALVSGGSSVATGGSIIAGLEAGLAAVPVAGWVALGALVIGGIISGMDKGPAERTASFGSGSGMGAGNPLFQSSSAFGNFGIFNDKWFSDADQGQAIQQFLGNLKTLDNAIANAVGPDTTAKISAALAAVTTDFSAGIEHQATSFGDVMQQRYSVVTHAISDELGGLVDNFKGTGEELAKFVTGVVGVYETLKRMDPQQLFGQSVSTTDVVNLAGPGGDVAATFTELVNVFTLTNAAAVLLGQDMHSAFGEVGLASKDAREQLINFAGGAQAFASALRNWQSVGFTDAQKLEANTTHLNDVFTQLGVTTIPHTWAELNTMINGFGVSTEAGRQLTAEFITQVVPAFAAVNGTAQDAANATRDFNAQMDQFAKTVDDAMRGLMTDAQRMQNDWQQIGSFWTVHGAEIFRLTNGAFTSLPTTNSGMLTLLTTLEQMGPDGLRLANEIVQFVIPSMNDLNGTLAKLAEQATNTNVDVGSIIGGGLSLADKLMQQVDTAIGVNGSASLGDKLAQRVTGIGKQIAQLDEQIANAPWYVDTRPLEIADTKLHQAYDKSAATYVRYTGLVRQYGDSIGTQLEQLYESYDTTVQALKGNPAALADAAVNFNTAWSDIVNGTKSGVTGTIDQLARLRQGLLDYVHQLTVGDTSILSPQERFGIAQSTFRSDEALAQAGNLDALGRLTKDADDYYKLVRENDASGGRTPGVFNEITTVLTQLGAGQKSTSDASTAIANALPTDSKIVSQKDAQALLAAMKENTDAARATAELLARIAGDTAETADATKKTASNTNDFTRVSR